MNMLNQRLLLFFVGALPFVGSFGQTVMASNADLSPDSVTLTVEFRYNPAAEDGARGSEAWVCYTESTKGITLADARLENGDVCTGDEQWERTLIEKSGSNTLNLTLGKVSQQQVDQVTVAFLVLIVSDNNGRSWISAKGTDESKFDEARLYTPPEPIALIEVDDRQALVDAGIPSGIIDGSMPNGDLQPPVEEGRHSNAVEAEPEQTRQQPSNPQPDDEGGFRSWVPGWTMMLLVLVLLFVAIYMVRKSVKDMDQRLSRMRSEIRELKNASNPMPSTVPKMHQKDAELLFSLVNLDPNKLAGLDVNEIKTHLNALSNRIDNLERIKEDQDPGPTPPNPPVPTFTPEHAFLQWCQKGGGQMSKALFFQKELVRQFRAASVEPVFRDMNNEASLIISKRKETPGAPQEYWLISNEGRHLLVPQPQTVDKFREIHPQIYQASQVSPSRLRSIKPAIAEVAGDTVRLLSSGCID